MTMHAPTQPPDWEQMPYFLAVARTGSLRAAAALLGAGHATVNRQVNALEATYGVRLFDRGQSGMTLTAAGQVLLPMAEQAEAVFVAARRGLKGMDREEQGTVRFSVSASVAYQIIAPMLAKFTALYPGIELEIRIADRFEDISKMETDVSLRLAEAIDDDVVARRLGPIALGTYASRDYLEAHLPKAGEGGAGLHWIGWGAVDPDPAWRATSDFPQATMRHATADHPMQLELARQGLGMVSSASYIAEGYTDLLRVPGTVLNTNRSLWLLLHSDLRRTTRVRRFVDFIAAESRQIAPQLRGQLPRQG